MNPFSQDVPAPNTPCPVPKDQQGEGFSTRKTGPDPPDHTLPGPEIEGVPQGTAQSVSGPETIGAEPVHLPVDGPSTAKSCLPTPLPATAAPENDKILPVHPASTGQFAIPVHTSLRSLPIALYDCSAWSLKMIMSRIHGIFPTSLSTARSPNTADPAMKNGSSHPGRFARVCHRSLRQSPRSFPARDRNREQERDR